MLADTEFVRAQSLCVYIMCAEVDEEDKLVFLLTIAIFLYTLLNDYVPPSGTLVTEFYFSNYDMFCNRQYLSVVIEMCSSPE